MRGNELRMFPIWFYCIFMRWLLWSVIRYVNAIVVWRRAPTQRQGLQASLALLLGLGCGPCVGRETDVCWDEWIQFQVPPQPLLILLLPSIHGSSLRSLHCFLNNLSQPYDLECTVCKIMKRAFLIYALPYFQALLVTQPLLALIKMRSMY